MTSWQQDRRRAASRQFTSDNARALASLVGGLGDARDMLLDDEERKRKTEADTATQGLLRARTDAAKTTAESGLLKAKADEATSQEKLLRTKSESEEKSARVTREAAADEAKARPQKIASAATDVESEISMPGGVSQAQLEQIAVSRGLPASDWRTVLNERDANVDKTNKEAAEMANLSAQTEQRSAAAAKARRAPTGPKPKSPEEIKRQEVKDKISEATLRQLEGKPAAAGKLTSGEAEGIIELQTGQEILNNIEALKNSGGAGGAPINTGPIEAGISWFSTQLGVESPEKAKFKAETGAQLAEYIKSISGGAVSEPERASLIQNTPTPIDDDEEFLAKLQAVRNILTTKLATKRRAYEATGKDTAIFGAAPAPAPAAPAPSAKVRVSNGEKMGEVAKADLGEFLAENPGWKVVR